MITTYHPAPSFISKVVEAALNSEVVFLTIGAALVVCTIAPFVS